MTSRFRYTELVTSNDWGLFAIIPNAVPSEDTSNNPFITFNRSSSPNEVTIATQPSKLPTKKKPLLPNICHLSSRENVLVGFGQ